MRGHNGTKTAAWHGLARKDKTQRAASTKLEGVRCEAGENIKRPVSAKEAKKSPKKAARRRSFCARMKGMKKKLTSAKTRNDPNSRINKALRKWDC